MGDIVVACVQKGGSGKTFFARHCSVEWALRGQRVIVIDADPQGTATHWAGLAAAFHTLVPPVYGVDDNNMEERIRHYAAQCDVLIVDTQGALNDRLATALELADLALIPVNPTKPEDIWGLADTLAVVADAQRELRPELQAFIAITGKTSTKISEAARIALGKHSMPKLRTELKHSNDYNTATVLGRGITSHKPKSPAAQEFRALVDELEELLPGMRARRQREVEGSEHVTQG